MDFSTKNGLALLAIALACARSYEQLLPVVRSRRFGPASAVSPHVSLLSPFAGAAALAYGHAIGADTALLVATWLHTATATLAVMLTTLDLARRHVAADVTAQEIHHD